MDFIDSPTERTTAITDAILAIQCFGLLAVLLLRPRRYPFRTRTWAWIFGLMAFASALGAAAHGFQMSDTINAALWAPLNLALGLLITLFAVAAVSHGWDDATGSRGLPLAVGVAAFFFLLTQFVSGSFLYFIAFEAITILIVLAIFGLCLVRGERRPGSPMLTLGVTLCLVAAMIDVVHPLRIACIWEFDNHGLFHMVQMSALLPLSIGAVQSCGRPDLPTSAPLMKSGEAT